MANPLSKFVEVEDRDDGVYIKVTRSQQQNLAPPAFEKCLEDALVINADMNAISGVIKRARGVFEKIGPPFEVYNPKFDSYIFVQTTPLKAIMNISSESIVSEIKLTPGLIRYGLARKGVTFGIKEDTLMETVANVAYDTEIIIAEGEPPERGINGQIEMEVDINPDSTPSIDQSGKCDFRNIKSFVAVKKGQVLARRIPPKEGKPGTSVTGEKIESEKGIDVQLPSGKNTSVSPDGLTLTSSNDGIVFMQSGLIYVGELLTIPGDVNYSVGNIKYSGDVLIQGGVKPGFCVETEGNIEIQGEVESAKIISRKGYVTIGRGVIGKNETEIYGEKGVTVNFAQECDIKTEGTLVVEKYLLYCQAVCSIFQAEASGSGIVGGDLTVYKYIDAMNIGNDKNIETNINLVDKNKNKLQEKLKELETLRKEIEKQLDPVSRQLKSKTMILKNAGTQATDRLRQELKKWANSYNSLNMKIKYVNTKSEEIKAKLNSPSNYQGHIKVKGTIHGGVKLDLYGISQKKMQSKMTNKVFKIIEGAIQSEG